MKSKKTVNIKQPYPSLLIKTIVLLLAVMCLCCILAFLLFSYLGFNTYAKIQKNDLESRAEYIADLTADYFERKITRQRYYSMIKDEGLWTASVYVYRIHSDVPIAWNNSDSNESERLEMIDKYRATVLSGKSVTDMDGITVGVPVISSYGNVIGAVFMIRPLPNLHTSMNHMRNSLVISLALSFAAMLIPIYLLASYGISKPIRRMAEVAQEMANGNYDETVNVPKGDGELASLGHSLNVLSGSLKTTIGTLESERNILNEVLNSMSDAVFTLDLDGNIIQINSVSQNIFKTDNDTNDQAVRRTIISHLDAMDKTESAPIEFSTMLGDRILSVHMNLITPSDKDKSDGYVTVIIRDITEAARYEQSRKDYVANVSHELRTPIANIKGITEALCDGIIAEDDLMKYYGHLYKESDRLSRLINDLLQLSRIQSGKLSIEKRRTNVYDIIMSAADILSSLAKETGRTIQPVCDQDIGYAYTNSDRIEQILVTLIDNAIKHSNSETIILRAEDKQTHFNISVENTGSIDPADIPHLFERFYKADKSHCGEGTGLGLSIASEMIDLLNEKIWVSSKDNTVTFTFTLAKYNAKKR